VLDVGCGAGPLIFELAPLTLHRRPCLNGAASDSDAHPAVVET
jgi:hypothetical protein